MGSSRVIVVLLLSSLAFNNILGHTIVSICLPFLKFHCQPKKLTPKALPSPDMPPPQPSPPSTEPQVPSPPAIPSPQQESSKSQHASEGAPTPTPTHNLCVCELEFLDQRLAAVYSVIQKFKNLIISDPFGITSTWVGADICSYNGFYCDHPPDNASATTLASIDFNGYQLSAPTLIGFLDQLPDIALFHANSNNFGGIISPSIAKLQYLYELDLSNNKFTGPFPTALLGMAGLTFLDLRFNAFTGSVPPAIYNQNLNVLFLNDNDFISSLPYNLNRTHILYLTLADNKFTGPIPRDITSALSALTEVLLLNNQLTGCLPYELGLLKQVTLFDISNNLLTGPLPFSLSCLETVEVLNFAGNLLNGVVPDQICGLPNIANLSLSNNYFTRVGPLCRNLISRGVLDVQNNCIPGQPLQRSLVDCAAFFALPRICPHMETYKIIPCKPSHFP